ncbi:MAG: aminotransferase class V-fold PLP-dependent enzyme [Fidelibacterota bacterium]
MDASAYNVKKIRESFPIFNQTDQPPLVYLDNAATTQKPIPVLNAVNQFYNQYNANVHRGLYRISERATKAYESVRDKVAEFIGAEDRRSIIFTKGTTESINLVAYSWARKNLKPGDEILITEMEHHSNLVPWQLAAQSTGATLKFIPLGDSGTLDFSESQKYFGEHTKLVSFTHQSNVLGTINPVKDIIRKAKNAGAKTFIDGAQFVPHSKVNVSDLDCDFYAFSGHKMMAPTGVGVLYGKPDLLNSMDPFLSGGDMILSVSMDKTDWNEIPYKFEAGTPNIAQVIGLGAAIDYINSLGAEHIDNHIRFLTNHAKELLEKIPGLNILGHTKNMDATTAISFYLNDIHPHDIAQILDVNGIAVRAGHHCAQPVADRYNITSSVRASFYLYTTLQDIEKLIHGLFELKKYF